MLDVMRSFAQSVLVELVNLGKSNWMSLKKLFKSVRPLPVILKEGLVVPEFDLEILPWKSLAHGKQGYAMLSFPNLDRERSSMVILEGWDKDLFFETANLIEWLFAQIPGAKNHSNILLSRVTPGQVIQKHVDADYHRRVHVPLKTNPQALFITEEWKINMEVGKAYLVDPSMSHSVVNGGDKDRIHLMFDLAD